MKMSEENGNDYIPACEEMIPEEEIDHCYFNILGMSTNLYSV